VKYDREFQLPDYGGGGDIENFWRYVFQSFEPQQYDRAAGQQLVHQRKAG